MRPTPAVLALRVALAKALLIAAHDGQLATVVLAEHWEAERLVWQGLADQLLDEEGSALAEAVNQLRREAFEAGASPALSVLLVELQESDPDGVQGDGYGAGLARSVELLSQEMGQHYGAVFEAGRRVGRTEAEKTLRERHGPVA